LLHPKPTGVQAAQLKAEQRRKKAGGPPNSRCPDVFTIVSPTTAQYFTNNCTLFHQQLHIVEHNHTPLPNAKLECYTLQRLSANEMGHITYSVKTGGSRWNLRLHAASLRQPIVQMRTSPLSNGVPAHFPMAYQPIFQ
jgi:hypothetical protein